MVLSISSAGHAERNHLAYVLSLFGFLYFNLAWVVNPRFSGHKTSELSYFMHFLSNLGILSLSNAYAYVRS